MSKTPEQTIIDTSVDPSLSYLQSKQVGQLVSTENGIITTRTDKGNVINTLENVTKVVTKVVETNVLADWTMNDPENTSYIRNKPNLGNYYTKVETELAIAGSIGELIHGAPTALNTLNELANALGNDASYASTITNQLANKADTTYVDGLFNSIGNVSTGNIVFTDTTMAPVDDTANITISAGGNNFVFDTDGTLTIPNSIAVSGNGSPVFSSANDFSISAENRVKILNGSFKLAAKTSGERALLLPQPGDMIFHIESSQVQVYANGSWVPLGTGVANQSLNTTDDATFDGITLTYGFVNFPTGGEVYTNNNGSIDLYTDWGSGNGVEVWLQHDNRVSITTNEGAYEWAFDKTGNVSVPGNIIFPQLSPQELNASPAPVLSGIVFSDGTVQTTAPVSSNPFNQDLNTTDSVTFSNVTLGTQVGSASTLIQYGTGNLAVWNDGGWTIGEYNGTNWGQEGIRINPGIEGSVDITLPSDANASTQSLSITNGQGNVTINANSNYWKFNNDGSLDLPNYVHKTATNNVSCQPNMDTVVYTASSQWQHTFKILFKIEGNEANPGAWDTQSCEMMVAKSFNGDKVAGSVYGLVYTSTSPLATLTARWNQTSSRVEILCRPTSTTMAVQVRSYVTEITTSD